MFVVSENGMKAASFSAEFYRYAKERGIRDPFEVSRQLFAKKCRREGTDMVVDFEWDKTTGKIKDDPAEPTRAEKDAYIIMRDEYVAQRCFEEIGYDMFLAHTKPDPNSKYDISYMRERLQFVPCHAAGGQCAFECPQYKKCQAGMWNPNEEK